MSINSMVIYTKCPHCGQTNTKTDYHENTSSDRSEVFEVLNAQRFKCQYCAMECDADIVYTDRFSHVEDKKHYKRILKNKLIQYCSGTIPFISFSDWDFEIAGKPQVTEQPVLSRLCAIYPDDQDFKTIAEIYRCIRLHGKDYLNKLETGDRIISQGHLKIPECLRKVYLHNGVEIIGKRAFCGCNALWDIFLPDTVKIIEEEAFLKAGLKTIHTSSKIEYFGKRAFAECKNLKQFFVPNNIIHIGDRCFEECVQLACMFIPKNVSLGEQVFVGCMALKKVELPNHLKQDNIREKLGLQDCTEIIWYE